MRWVAAAGLALVGAFFAVVGAFRSLGEALCDSGDCPPPTSWDEIMFWGGAGLLVLALAIAVSARDGGGVSGLLTIGALLLVLTGSAPAGAALFVAAVGIEILRLVRRSAAA